MSRDTGEVGSAMHHWSRRMGENHGRRDRAASLQTQTLVELEHERHTACLQRWPAIVAAMKTLVASYNEGACSGALALAEDSAKQSVTLESTNNGRSALVMTLDGADVSVRTRNGHADPVNGTRWVSLNRTDEDAAAYLLRNWMEQL
jgi:hypothetical protein